MDFKKYYFEKLWREDSKLLPPVIRIADDGLFMKKNGISERLLNKTRRNMNVSNNRSR